MRVSRQAAAIAASVVAVLGIGGGAWALSTSGGSGQQVQTADTVSPSASPSSSPSESSSASPAATVSPSASDPMPSTAAPATTEPTTRPTTTKKGSSKMSTPTGEPATSHPVSTDPPGATAGQWNGGTGTVDNGPYPSRGPVDGPTGDPYPVTP